MGFMDHCTCAPNPQNARESLKKLKEQNPLVTGDEKILVIGAKGQVAQFLVPALKELYPNNLILTDATKKPEDKDIELLDVTKDDQLKHFISKDKNVKVIINLAALLSGLAEEKPALARAINIEAPKKILELAKEAGVKTLFMPSSIAVLGRDARLLGNQGDAGTPIDAPVNPIGNYGLAKKEIEELFAENNKEQKDKDGLQALCLRYGGVLTCQPKPSNGTTEEIDKLIVVAAKLKAKQNLAGQNGKLNGHARINGASHDVFIPYQSTFPLLDGSTVATETLRFLHAPREKLWENGHRYPLAEYSASISEVAHLLSSRVKGLNIHFKPKQNPAKERFTYTWPQKLDMSASQNDWQMVPHHTLESSIDAALNRLVPYFEKELKETALKR